MTNGSDEFQFMTAKRFLDERGFFQELGRGEFKQVNWSSSRLGVLRGLHYATYPKLVTCLTGHIFDVAVDCRLDSPTFGKKSYAILDRKNQAQVYIPACFAHGFMALEDSNVVYMQGGEWQNDDITVHYADPTIAVEWPGDGGVIVSKKDQEGLSWKDFLWLLKDLRSIKSS